MLEAGSRGQKAGTRTSDLAALSKLNMLFVQKDPGKEKNEHTYKLRGSEEEYLLKRVVVIFVAVETLGSAKRS